MAKMFYTLDETKVALGKSEDDIRQLAKEGQLREFRDGPRLMFKADQVEQLKQQLTGGGSDQVELSGDTGAPIGLADSRTGSGTGISLAPETAPPTPAGMAKEDSGAGMLKGDTGAGMDVGLSGSLGGSLGGASLAGSIGGTNVGPSGGKTRAKPGVNVFGADERPESVDPMAQTHITPPRDQISLEGVGSGSGLLDLTRETDDTSLGAALLDEISPGSTKRTTFAPSVSAGSTAGMPAVELEPSAMIEDRHISASIPVYVTPPDALAPALVAAGIAALIVLFVGALVLINAIVDTSPLVDARLGFVRSLGEAQRGFGFLFIAGLVLGIIFFVVGLVMGKMSNKQTA